jgi:hypothetical protein
MSLTIDDLLNSLQNPSKPSLENNAETWSRIRNKSGFEELGLEGSALDNFLKEWISENPYNNIG